MYQINASILKKIQENSTVIVNVIQVIVTMLWIVGMCQDMYMWLLWSPSVFFLEFSIVL